jgi:hypothetical protein
LAYPVLKVVIASALSLSSLQTVCSNLRLRFRSAAGVVIPVLIAAAVDLVYTGKPSVATFVMFGVAYGEPLACLSAAVLLNRSAFPVLGFCS